MGKVEKYEKLNKPGLWFVCSGQPATELKQYVYDFAVESGLPIVVENERDWLEQEMTEYDNHGFFWYPEELNDFIPNGFFWNNYVFFDEFKILSFTNSFSHLYLIDNLSELSHDYGSDYSRALTSIEQEAVEYNIMTVQEIFNTKAVQEIETEILNLQYETEKRRLFRDSEGFAIKSLLGIRRNILHDYFVMDENYKLLLSEFNEALKLQLIDMRNRTIKLYESVKGNDVKNDMIVKGNCFLGYGYSKIHPVQTVRAKKMWAMLNGTMDDFMPLYDDGACSFEIQTWGDSIQIQSENEMLYLQEEPDNWNEGLDRELTKDMHLIHAFHNLYEHMDFSIFDLLWVRDFNVELHAEIDYHTYKSDEYGDDLDWSKCDYWD